MKLKKRDLVVHESGMVLTVFKTYTKLESGEVFVQAFNDKHIVRDRVDSFKHLDCLLLRCNTCSTEDYEINLNVNNGVYVCECGSSTFTPLNLDIEECNY